MLINYNCKLPEIEMYLFIVSGKKYGKIFFDEVHSTAKQKLLDPHISVNSDIEGHAISYRFRLLCLTYVSMSLILESS